MRHALAMLWLVAVGACVARPPSAAEDAGVVDAGVDEEPPAGEPFGLCRITPDCRVGFCLEGRCLPPADPVLLNSRACSGDGLNLGRRATSLDPFLDCGEWGATCIPRRGCALPPGARCAIDGRRLLPCGSGDLCIDGRCVVDDVGGRLDATPLPIPGSAIFTLDGPDDLDCFIVDKASFSDFNVTSTASFFGNNTLDPETGELRGLLMCPDGPPGEHAIATAPRENLERCVDDRTISDFRGGTTTCPEGTVCRPSLATGFECAPAPGEPCAQADRCGGYCDLTNDVCLPLPSPLPPQGHCGRLADGRLHYRTGPLEGRICSDRCVDGTGCIDTTPTSTCSMFKEDPAGGLAPCATVDAPAWLSDDFPGHNAPAPLVGPGPYSLVATQAGDVDCVTVVATARGAVTHRTTSGQASTPGGPSLVPLVDVGEHVRVCVSGHEGTATLEVDITTESP